MKDKELFDAEAYNNDDFPKALRDVFWYDGEQMLMVQEASGLLFNYRKDLLQKYGVPEPPLEGYEWDAYQGHLKTIAEGLKKDGKTDVYPLLFGAKKPTHTNRQIVQNVWAKGGEIFDGVEADTSTIRDDRDGHSTCRPDVRKKYVTEGAVGYEYPDVLTGFQNGKA